MFWAAAVRLGETCMAICVDEFGRLMHTHSTRGEIADYPRGSRARDNPVEMDEACVMTAC
eukprot:355330-Chlamydomonas_euryale.AAC.4